jgi:hypothetical protein
MFLGQWLDYSLPDLVIVLSGWMVLELLGKGRAGEEEGPTSTTTSSEPKETQMRAPQRTMRGCPCRPMFWRSTGWRLCVATSCCCCSSHLPNPA